MTSPTSITRVALVTGAAKGIGAAIADRLARAGHHILIGDIDETLARAKAEALKSSGHRADAVLLDVGFPADALKGVPILARCAGLIGHLTEELARPIGFALSYQATRQQRYVGELPAGVSLKKGDGAHG